MMQGVTMVDLVSPTCCRYILSDLLELAGYEPRERSNVAITGIQTDVTQVRHSVLAHVACLSGMLTRQWHRHSSAMHAYVVAAGLIVLHKTLCVCKTFSIAVCAMPCHTLLTAALGMGQVQPGDLFVCVERDGHDGHDNAAEVRVAALLHAST